MSHALRPAQNRTWEVFDARTPVCPRCAKPLRRIHPLSGAALVTCDNRPPRAGHRRSQGRCGQTSYVLGVPGGLCLVFALDADQAEALSHRELPLYGADLLVALGALETVDS